MDSDPEIRATEAPHPKHPLTFENYIDQAALTAQYPESGHGTVLALVYVALGVAGEAGEIAGEIKKILRDDAGTLTSSRFDRIVKEMGDTYWYLARLHRELGVSVHDVLQGNIDKLYARYRTGTIKGDGEDRSPNGSAPVGTKIHEAMEAYHSRAFNDAYDNVSEQIVARAETLLQDDELNVVMGQLKQEFNTGPRPVVGWRLHFSPQFGRWRGVPIWRTFYVGDGSMNEARRACRKTYGPGTIFHGGTSTDERQWFGDGEIKRVPSEEKSS